jgi:glycosyltransferase involved in cell wall biosynthesis
VISIAMATYNGEQFLDEQLRSLNEQVTPPREMVVCDDQSTDRTRDILARFARQASFPVKLFTNDRRLGWRENFLQAARLCSSEYISFCDQDDVWLKEKLAVVESYLRRNPCTLLQHGFRLIDDAGNVITEELDWEYLELHEAPWRFSYGLTQVFHRSLLEFTDLWELSEDHFDPGQRMGHDQWIGFLSSLLGHTLSIKEVLLHYRQHAHSVVGWWSPADRVKQNTIVDLARTFGSKDFKKVKRLELIAFMERRFAASSARRIIAEKVAARVEADSVPRVLSKVQFYRDYTNYLSTRLSAYRSIQPGQRLGAILSALHQGQYRARGKRGARDAVVDVLYGVMG